MEVNNKLRKLRELMEERGITAYIVPTSDPHQSEYVADCYKSRTWISGFTGSAGTVIITKDKAILWTDGRYFIQAEDELKGSEFQLAKMGDPGVPTTTQWLRDNLNDGDCIGFHSKVFSQSEIEKIKNFMGDKKISIIDEFDLIGEIWIDRPAIPKGETFIHDVKYAGLTTKEKLEKVRKEINRLNADYFLIGSLDDIAWLYNIRGNDVPSNPVVISYALVSMDNSYLFVDKDKISKDVEMSLMENGVEVQSYEDIIHFIRNIKIDSKVILDKSRINGWLYNGIPKECEIENQMDITTKLKGIKNSVEIENQKNAYIKDGVALTKYIYWLDKNIGAIEITEISGSNKLEEFRKEQDLFLEPSFSTISAYGVNAAMAHYSATEISNAKLKPEGLYLVDSGGQYLDGTTDVTRTIALGQISEEERKDFTLTLKGHINLSNAKFLKGTNGYQLDIICRYPLWQEGLDYKHGTGHGIGFVLNVHEGPHRIASVPNDIVLEKGMIISIEPGVYKFGKHGIRIENIVVVDDYMETESGQFLGFETLSLVPIDLDAIDVSLLTETEKQWLNDYHEEVYSKIGPFLTEEENAWLKHKTRSI